MFVNVITCIIMTVFKNIVYIIVLVIMPHKIKRKLIRVGNTSIAVILPIPWLRYYNLKHGDRVEVVSNGSIKITPEKKKENLSDIEYMVDNFIRKGNGTIINE